MVANNVTMRRITARTTANSITFVRNNATAPGQDSAGESIIFLRNAGASTLQKDKSRPMPNPPPVDMASYVTIFAVTNATNEIQLRLTLSRTTGENITLQTKVYPKNLLEDTTTPPTYKNFRIRDAGGGFNYASWQEVQSP